MINYNLGMKEKVSLPLKEYYISPMVFEDKIGTVLCKNLNEALNYFEAKLLSHRSYKDCMFTEVIRPWDSDKVAVILICRIGVHRFTSAVAFTVKENEENIFNK